MKYTVYIVRCGDRTLYAGITSDLDRRLLEHNKGRASKYTRSRLPVKCVYSEPRPDKSSALKRELEIKNFSRKEKLALIRSRNKSRNSG